VDNIVRCLEAMEKDGEAGMNRELDRIFPGTSAKDNVLHSSVRDLGNGLVAETLPGGNGKIECHVVRVKNPGAH
jgi:hypothetical protein